MNLSFANLKPKMPVNVSFNGAVQSATVNKIDGNVVDLKYGRKNLFSFHTAKSVNTGKVAITERAVRKAA